MSVKSTLVKINPTPTIVVPAPEAPTPTPSTPEVGTIPPLGDSGIVTSLTSLDPRIVYDGTDGDVNTSVNLAIGINDTSPDGPFLTIDNTDVTHPILNLNVTGTGGGGGTITLIQNIDGSITIDSGGGPTVTVSLNLDNMNVWTKAQSVTPIDNSGNTLIDASTSLHFYWLLSGSLSLSNPINLNDGEVLTLIFQQDGSGNHTITWPSLFHFAVGGTGVIGPNANRVTIVTGIYSASASGIYCPTAVIF